MLWNLREIRPESKGSQNHSNTICDQRVAGSNPSVHSQGSLNPGLWISCQKSLPLTEMEREGYGLQIANFLELNKLHILQLQDPWSYPRQFWSPVPIHQVLSPPHQNCCIFILPRHLERVSGSVLIRHHVRSLTWKRWEYRLPGFASSFGIWDRSGDRPQLIVDLKS